jgi:hypothetical protein
MISTDPKNLFSIHWDILKVSASGELYGAIIIVIDGYTYPNKIDHDYILKVVFSNLKCSFDDLYYVAGQSGNELGEREVDPVKLDFGEEPDIFEIGTTELGTAYQNDDRGGLRIEIGYSGKDERVFVMCHNEQGYREFRFPKGTVEQVIRNLPS